MLVASGCCVEDGEGDEGEGPVYVFGQGWAGGGSPRKRRVVRGRHLSVHSLPLFARSPSTAAGLLACFQSDADMTRRRRGGRTDADGGLLVFYCLPPSLPLVGAHSMQSALPREEEGRKLACLWRLEVRTRGETQQSFSFRFRNLAFAISFAAHTSLPI